MTLGLEFHPLEPLKPYLAEVEIEVGQPVVASTPRGQQLGWVRQILEPTSESLSACRSAQPADLKLYQQRRLFAAEVEAFARLQVASLGLALVVVGAAQSLDGDWIVVYFAAPQRLDFRPLVKALGARFSKKVELNQLSERQRSQRVGALGRCGQSCCCTTWMREFPPVAVRMASEQGFQMQAEAISGVCGKLLCCLRFEYDAKLQARARYQPGEWVETAQGRAQVIEEDPHAQLVWLVTEKGEKLALPSGGLSMGKTCQSCRKGTPEQAP
jgi:cell fate regulator YaaT (PSP1 superfamily)